MYCNFDIYMFSRNILKIMYFVHQIDMNFGHAKPYVNVVERNNSF